MRAVLVSFLALSTLGAACSGPPPTPGSPAEGTARDTTEVGRFADVADYQRQRADAAAALDDAIGDAAASEVPACRVVATSEQACGGPTTFAVYSADAGDAAEVERLAARLVALDGQANRQFEWASTCMAYEPPTPVLRDGRCVDPAE